MTQRRYNFIHRHPITVTFYNWPGAASLATYRVPCEDWSDCMGVQVNLILHSVHMQFYLKMKILAGNIIFSSPEQKLRVSYYHHPLSVVVRHQQFWNNHHESCSICLSWWFLGQVWNWVTWGQKLGHQAKSAENLVNTLAFLKQSSWILLKMLILMIFRSSSKLGHLDSKTRSQGQISRKPC